MEVTASLQVRPISVLTVCLVLRRLKNGSTKMLVKHEQICRQKPRLCPAVAETPRPAPPAKTVKTIADYRLRHAKQCATGRRRQSRPPNFCRQRLGESRRRDDERHATEAEEIRRVSLVPLLFLSDVNQKFFCRARQRWLCRNKGVIHGYSCPKL